MMNKTLFILLAICALAAAMVTRRGRALNLDKEDVSRQFSTSDDQIKYCASSTPCSWSIYSSYTKNIIMNITNTYCICAPGYTCEAYIYDESSLTNVYRCQVTEN